MRNALDWVYRLAGAAAVVLLVLIGVLTVAQITARLAGSIVPSADDFATFSMAASIFFGLAYTYRLGGHVRVRLLENRLPPTARRWMEILCLAVAAGMLGWIMWYTQDMIRTSYGRNEHSLGLIPVPMWLPMSSMLIGLLVLFLAVIDDFVAVLRNRKPSYAAAEESEDLTAMAAE